MYPKLKPMDFMLFCTGGLSSMVQKPLGTLHCPLSATNAVNTVPAEIKIRDHLKTFLLRQEPLKRRSRGCNMVLDISYQLSFSPFIPPITRGIISKAGHAFTSDYVQGKLFVIPHVAISQAIKCLQEVHSFPYGAGHHIGISLLYARSHRVEAKGSECPT